MRIETTTVQAFRIYDAGRLDPVLVILHDIQPGKGRLIVECCGDSWSGYWGAIGERNIAQFVRSSPPDYITGGMLGFHHHRSQGSQRYLERIIHAVQEALCSIDGVTR